MLNLDNCAIEPVYDAGSLAGLYNDGADEYGFE